MYLFYLKICFFLTEIDFMRDLFGNILFVLLVSCLSQITTIELVQFIKILQLP